MGLNVPKTFLLAALIHMSTPYMQTTNDTVKILGQLTPLIPIGGVILQPILCAAQQILEKAQVSP